MWLAQDLKKTVSNRGKFTEPSDLTSDLRDTRKTARIKSPRKSSLRLTCMVLNLTTTSTDGKWAVIRPPNFATKYVSFATNFYTW